MTYQVQYKNETKTFTDTFEANSHIEIIDFFQDLINAEITEIREVVYTNPIYPKDDGDYIKGRKVYLKNQNGGSRSFNIPKVKKNIDDEYIKELVFNNLKMNNKSIFYVSIYNL